MRSFVAGLDCWLELPEAQAGPVDSRPISPPVLALES